jgi:hypothetical protein
MTDWIEHDGGPQRVADDVWMEVMWPTPEGLYLATCRDEIETADEIPWEGERFRYHVLNQHLIDAARLEGIREGRDAAFRALITQFLSNYRAPPEWHRLGTAISALDPATIAREAVLDKLAREAQEQGMGYEKETDQ